VSRPDQAAPFQGVSRRRSVTVVAIWEIAISVIAPIENTESTVKAAIEETLQDGLKYLSDFDLDAIADYLFAQPPIVHKVRTKP
jgi:hypothetical protein